MSEIEVGEYGRTNTGKIFIFAWLVNSNNERYNNKVLIGNGKSFSSISFYYFEKDEMIVKHSKNIIDVIEVGDFVNERLVLQVDYKNKNVCLLIPFTDTKANTNIMWYGYEDIKKILTKEQHNQNCYRLEE